MAILLPNLLQILLRLQVPSLANFKVKCGSELHYNISDRQTTGRGHLGVYSSPGPLAYWQPIYSWPGHAATQVGNSSYF